MQTISLAAVELALLWNSPDGAHVERRFSSRIDPWRDIFPGDLGERLARAAVGETARITVAPGALVPAHDATLLRSIRAGQFRREPRPGQHVTPRRGRFYPRTFLRDLPDVYPDDLRPFRVTAVQDEILGIDLNHPFARYGATLEARLAEILHGREQRGGSCNDIGQALADGGPGMQVALADQATDFLGEEALQRLDPRDDALFYDEPRFVQHIDRTAIAHIAAIYARFLQPGMKVLDLMSSWVSHLPVDAADVHVTGLGMNAAELQRNAQLRARVVHDMNAQPVLPFADAAFDLAVCTVSVEYLTRPVEVFREVARVLRPGGAFVCTFSDRWFPTKVIRLWTELHPYERMGLVLDFFRRAGGFATLGTETLRGWPRPADDKYAAQLAYSDPVFAVFGTRTGSAR